MRHRYGLRLFILFSVWILMGAESQAVSDRSDIAEAFGTMQVHEQVQQTLRQVNGEIQRVKTVRLLGTDTHHLIVLIKSRRGDYELVSDLGPARELRRYQINLGDTISILGKVTAVDGQPVLVAQKLQIRGQVHQVRRRDQLRLAERFQTRERADSKETGE